MKKIKLNPGEIFPRKPNNPIIELIGGSKRGYVWVGNDAEDDKYCFGTVGVSSLKKLLEDK